MVKYQNKFILYTIILFFIIFLIIISLYTIYFNIIEKKQNNKIQTCPLNQCATDVITGKKNCPNEGEQIQYNINKEVCNYPNICNNTITPFALRDDGGTNNNGVCEKPKCNCITRPLCPNFISSAFSSNSINENNSIYDQINIVQYGEQKNISYCYVVPNFIVKSSPGCSFIKEINKKSMSDCMHLSKLCNNNIKSSPCLKGTLAYIQNDKESIDIKNTPLGCVNKESTCNCDQINIYNIKNENLFCI